LYYAHLGLILRCLVTLDRPYFVIEVDLLQHRKASSPSKKPTTRDRILVTGSETLRATSNEHETEKEKRE
jgi:hypothetical protein